MPFMFVEERHSVDIYLIVVTLTETTTMPNSLNIPKQGELGLVDWELFGDDVTSVVDDIVRTSSPDIVVGVGNSLGATSTLFSAANRRYNSKPHC